MAASRLPHPLLAPLPIDLSDGLSPAEAAVLAVLANPHLKAVRDTHGEAAAQLMAAGLLPNPVFSGEVDHPYGRGAGGTINARTFSLEMDVGGLVARGSWVAAATAQLKAVDLGIAWQEWQTAEATRLATVQLAMLRRRMAVVGDEVAFEKHTVSVVVAALQEGNALVEDVGVHRVALERLRQLKGDLARAAIARAANLNLLLGLPPQTRLTVVAPRPEAWRLSELPAAPALLRQAMVARLDVQALKLGYRAQEATLRAAVLGQFPSLAIGINHQRDETDLHFLGGFVTLGLPLFNRNQAEIARQAATRERLRDEYRARIAEIRSHLTRLVDTDRLIAKQIATARRRRRARGDLWHRGARSPRHPDGHLRARRPGPSTPHHPGAGGPSRRSVAQCRTAPRLQPGGPAGAHRSRVRDPQPATAEAPPGDPPGPNDAVQQAEKAVASARAVLAGLGVESTPRAKAIRAPFSGVVAKVLVTSGAQVHAGEDALLMAPATGLAVRAGFEPEDAARLKPDMQVAITPVFGAAGDTVVRARLSRLHHVVDPDTQLVEALIQPTKIPAWMVAGIKVHVSVLLHSAADAVRIPRAALLDRDGVLGLFVVRSGVAHWQPVQVGLKNERWVSISRGIEPGAEVVTTGRTSLTDGMAVTTAAQAGG